MPTHATRVRPCRRTQPAQHAIDTGRNPHRAQPRSAQAAAGANGNRRNPQPARPATGATRNRRTRCRRNLHPAQPASSATPRQAQPAHGATRARRNPHRALPQRARSAPVHPVPRTCVPRRPLLVLPLPPKKISSSVVVGPVKAVGNCDHAWPLWHLRSSPSIGGATRTRQPRPSSSRQSALLLGCGRIHRPPCEPYPRAVRNDGARMHGAILLGAGQIRKASRPAGANEPTCERSSKPIWRPRSR